jgi:cytochrome P450
LKFLLDGRNRYGDVFRHDFGPLHFHLVAHPDHVRHVLLDNQRNYPRSWYYDRLHVVVGEGLVTTEGDAWRRLRRIVQPAFHRERIEALVKEMTNVTDSLRIRWQANVRSGEPIDFALEFLNLTLQIVGRTLLGIELGGKSDPLGPALTTGLEYGEHRLLNLLSFPPGVPSPINLRFKRALRCIDSAIYEIISTRRNEPANGRPDLLSLLLSARDEETGEGLTDRELRDQIYTFIAAGQETTAVALAWTFYLLGENPESEARLREEVESVLGGRVPHSGDVRQLRFTRQVIEESLRIYPPVYVTIRDVKTDDEIGGYPIPARSMVSLSPYVTHRHPEFWPDPERFDPDRFTLERSAERPRFAWFPFLGGPHQCIGQEFAMMEATVVVAMLVQAFRFRLVDGARVEPRPILSLRPRYGVPMIVTNA